jgi:hypothetical protein
MLAACCDVCAKDACSLLRTGAVFESFLGQDSLDEIGKQNVGNGMLWVANGFRCVAGCGWVAFPA